MDPTARTAMTRRTASLPARLLRDKGLVCGRVLDYGSGKGLDASTFGWEAYDPHHGPKMPRGRFDTILVTYVLNILSEAAADVVMEDVRGRLRAGGRAYLTVRRDLVEEPTASQRLVFLALPHVLDVAGGFVTYRLDAAE